MYPQYWRQAGADGSFQQYLSVLKEFYCKLKTISLDGETLIVPEMLSSLKLDTEQSLFKLTMKANYKAICAPPFDVNLIVKLWRTLSA